MRITIVGVIRLIKEGSYLFKRIKRRKKDISSSSQHRAIFFNPKYLMSSNIDAVKHVYDNNKKKYWNFKGN